MNIGVKLTKEKVEREVWLYRVLLDVWRLTSLVKKVLTAWAVLMIFSLFGIMSQSKIPLVFAYAYLAMFIYDIVCPLIREALHWRIEEGMKKLERAGEP